MPTEGNYRDQTLTCVDCERPFQFTAGEQRWFVEKGFHAPKRCKDCRQAKKAAEDSRRQGGRA